jgi:AAA+ ATPase superfamily predicted ATPase
MLYFIYNENVPESMIPKSMFVNRERDLGFLDEKHKSNKAELIIIYGRRREGKTRLLQEFVTHQNELSVY